MGNEELDPVFVGANNKTVLAFNSTSTLFCASENINPLLAKQIRLISNSSLKPWGKKKPARYLDPRVFMLGFFSSFHSTSEIPDSVKELPKQSVKDIVVLFPAQTERSIRRNHLRGWLCCKPLLQTSLL